MSSLRTVRLGPNRPSMHDIHLDMDESGTSQGKEELTEDDIKDALLEKDDGQNQNHHDNEDASAGTDSDTSSRAAAATTADADAVTIASTAAAAMTPVGWWLETVSWRKLAAEAVGTGMIVLFGCGSVCATMSGACKLVGEGREWSAVLYSAVRRTEYPSQRSSPKPTQNNSRACTLSPKTPASGRLLQFGA